MSSDSELDDELLQVAGQRKKGSSAAAKRKRAKMASSGSDEDVSLDEESDWEDADRNKKPRKTAKDRAGASAPAGGDFGAIDPEDLIIDEEDRKRLAAMTELEREMEINNRVDRRQQELQRMQLLAAAEGGDPTAQKGRKSRGAAPRRSGREIREETAKKSAIEELKAARERKARGQKARGSEDEEGMSVSEGEEGEDRQPLGAYDDEDADAGPRRWEPRDDYYDEEAAQEAAYDDAKTIQVRRHRLEEWFTKPFFVQTLPGCLVRLATGAPIGSDGRRGETKYMVAQVVGVEEREKGHHKYNPGAGPWKTPYSFGPDETKTSYWLRVVRGKSERYWPLAQVSNSHFTDIEWASWHKVCENEKRRQVTRGEVDEVRARLEAAEKYVYTSEDVTRLLEERRLKGQGPRNIAIERARLERTRDAAVEAGDEEQLAAAEAALEELTATAAVAAKARRGSGASMAQINKKNADRNFKVALKGEGAAAAANGGDGKDAATAGTMDPFSRRITRPQIYWNTQRQDAGGSQALDTEGEAVETKETAVVAAPSARVAPVEAAVVDLSGLDLSLLDAAPRIDPLARKLLGRGVGVAGATARAAVKGRPPVSLAEYKRRQQAY